MSCVYVPRLFALRDNPDVPLRDDYNLQIGPCLSGNPNNLENELQLWMF